MSQEIKNVLSERLVAGLFDIAPFNIAVIDRDFNVVAANKNFEQYFGDWSGKRCYETYKARDERCIHCQAVATFADGKVRVALGPLAAFASDEGYSVKPGSGAPFHGYKFRMLMRQGSHAGRCERLRG